MTKMHPESSRTPLVVMLHNLRSAYNTGSIFRTADAMLIDHVFLSGFTPDPTHPKVRKTALGAEQFVPWSRVEDPAAAIDQCKAAGYTIAGLECAPGSIHLSDVARTHFPMMLIAGNEVDGVPHDMLQSCDIVFEIAQLGMKQSLNVSVATGIALHTLAHFYMVHDPQLT